MNRITIQDIVAATGGTLLCGDEKASVTAICTDTRKITPGALFVPIIGETFDGHDFIDAALAGGCCAALTQRKEITGSKTLIAVDDTRKALGALAAYYRRQFNIPFAVYISIDDESNAAAPFTDLPNSVPLPYHT